jgi:aminoglycoside 3-N-acetyltransferase
MSRLIPRSELVAQAKAIGLAAGDTIMVHASMRAAGNVLGGPDVLISALAEAISPGGTILVYVGCQMPYDDVGRGIYNAEDEQLILAELPSFDPVYARASRDFGIFAEFFRTTRGVVCSTNPGSRMAAWGEKAEYLTKDHPMNYGLGKGSPLERLCELGGKVVLIGSDPDCVTLLHYAEALAPIEDKELVHIKMPMGSAEGTIWVEVEEFNSSTGIKDWPDRFFALIVNAFIADGRSVVGRLGNAETHILDAQGLVNYAIPIMVATAEKLQRN